MGVSTVATGRLNSGLERFLAAVPDCRTEAHPVRQITGTDTHRYVAARRPGVPTPSDTLGADPHLGPLYDSHGPVTIEPAEDLFERTVVAIVNQQLSIDSAAAIRERLFEAVEITPAGVLAADTATLRETGLSGSKAEYVQNVAEAFDDNGYDHAYFEGMSDETVADELTEIAGIGPWSADMVLMFGLGREDVFPVGDLGIRQGMHDVVDPDLTRAEMVEHAETWAPHRSYASLLLWNAVD